MESTGRSSFSQYWRLIQGNANFRRLWIAQMISETGDWMYIVAIYDQLLRITGGAASSIGFAFVMQVLPQMLVSPLAGVLNDRLRRRDLMIGSDVARMVIVAAMMGAAHLGWVWLIYVLLFFETVFWGIFEPGRSAVIPNITEGEERLTANSLSSMTWSFNFAAGFSVGGFIAASLGNDAVYVLNSFSFLLSAWFLSRMKFEEPHLEAHGPLRMKELFDFTPVMEGMRYVARDARLLATMLVKFGLGFLGANWVIVTILGDREFAVRAVGVDAKSAGVLGMSILMGARGLGALLGPLIGTQVAGNKESRQRKGILLGFCMASVGYLSLSQAGTMLVACLCLFVAHAGGSLVWVFSSTMLQNNSEDKFRGRVFSAEFAFMTLSMSISSSTAGRLIDSGMAPKTVAAYAGMAILAPAAAWFMAQRLWRHRDGQS